jgi:predicted GTPase
MPVRERRRVVICGAAGRDYHNFNVVYRQDAESEVVAFTATQIPGIADRTYPPALAGPFYPNGIPIVDEAALEELVRSSQVDEVIFAYSDVAHREVMHVASRVVASGADFTLLGPESTMVRSQRPVIAVSGVRTGCGKSQVARFVAKELRSAGRNVVAIRHPMPYGNLRKQAVQRFATFADITAAGCTLEEREEYEPHVAAGNVIYAGADYQAIVEAADTEAEVLIWDGGNNDFPFIQPDLHLVVVDALRPDQLTTHHPGEAVLRMADIVIINKADATAAPVVDSLRQSIADIMPDTPVLLANSPVTLAETIKEGSKVLIVEDGPTITHGGMATGSGYQAVKDLNVEIVDPRLTATENISAVFQQFAHIGQVLPAMGYSPEQRLALKQTIERSDADVVVAGTPIDLARDLDIRKPVVRAHYRYADAQDPGLMSYVYDFLDRQ